METKNPMKTKKWLWYAAAALLCFIAIAAFAWSAANKSKNTNAVAVANKNVNSAANSNAAAGQNANSSLANTNTNTNNNTNASANTNASQIVTAAKTIDETAITLVQKSTGHCEALAPLDWSFVTNAEGSGADLYSADKSLKAAMHAGWGISAVYTYMYPTVDSFLSAWLGYAYTGSFTNGGITLAAAQDVYEGFIQREFTTSNGRKGVAIYKTYNFGDPTMYVVSVYIADTASDKWETSGAQPFYVALTIRCVTQLRPVTSSVDPYTSDPGSSSDNPEVGLSDKWTEAIMGYENVYSPTTGEHYEAPLTSEWQGGPQGTGYYRSLPNGGYEKLEPGFGEY